MDFKPTAAAIVKHIGGKENIKSVVHCATRLRFTLHDSSLPDTAAILEEKPVLQVFVVGGQYQIVIGPNVPKLYSEIITLCGMQSSEAVSDPAAEKQDKWLWLSRTFLGIFGGKKAADDGLLHSPALGELIPLCDVNDEAFSSGILGKGLAIIPSLGEIYAPVSGTLTTIPASGHAVGITTDDGAEILIHVGMDTVSLKGEGFSPVVKEGARVTRGQLLLRFDIEFIKSKGLSTVTPIVIANSDEYNVSVVADKGTVTDKATAIIKYK